MIPSMPRRFLSWWESLPARRQVLVASPAIAVVLFCVHEAFFPLLEWHDSLLYAVMECVPVALVLAFATHTELTRRALDTPDTSDPDAAGDDHRSNR